MKFFFPKLNQKKEKLVNKNNGKVKTNQRIKKKKEKHVKTQKNYLFSTLFIQKQSSKLFVTANFGFFGKHSYKFPCPRFHSFIY